MKVVNLIFAAFLLIFISCENPTSQLIGTWKVVDVETHFDEAKMSPAMISQVVEMQKETFFKISNDSTLIIFSSENTHEAKWTYNSDDQSITYFFDSNPTTINKLGTLKDGNIVSETTSAIGKMVVTYGKQPK